MIDTNFNFYDASQSFKTPSKNNHSDTALSPQVILGYD